MDRRKYDSWKEREAQYLKERRSRRYKKVNQSKVAYAWDSTDPPIKFEALISTWQNCLIRFYRRAANSEATAQEAWFWARPSRHSAWHLLDDNWKSSLGELHEAACS